MNKATDSSEVLRLRKELVHARTQIADLQEELEEKNNLYIKAISDRDQYKEKLTNAKESINRVETIVQSKVNFAMDKERKELSKLREENDLLRKRIELFDSERLNSQQREKQLQDKINGLTQDLQFYARNVDMRDVMQRIEALRVEKDSKEGKIIEQLQFINKLSHQVEDLAAENRTLRQMASVPENYGINLEQIKLHDREKIDDYKKLIRVLQEDNYKLEEERARLKHMLKQQSMLYKTDDPQHRYKNLTPDQLFKVDQFVLKLLAGETEEPADFYKLKKENQTLKAQLEALNTKGFDFAKASIEAFLKELGLGDSGKLLERLNSGNEELKKMIRELLTKGFMSVGSDGKSQSMGMYGDFGNFRPPLPSVGVDGDVQSGFSYKFRTHLDVKDKDGRTGLQDQTRYDVAFMMLQVQECLELVKRKDEELVTKNNEIDTLYKKVRDYLLVQDQLYKDFVKMEKDYKKKEEDMNTNLRDVRDKLYEEQHKVKSFENLIQTLQKNDKQSIEMRLIELTKQNSLLDINLLRLTRKYQTLEEQEQLLRREYHNKEADLAEKDRFVQLRINMLKEWKARAIQQLKFLFTKLRLAVPKTEFQSVQRENEILKQKNADYIERNSKLAERVSKLQTKVRENMEAEDKLKLLTEMKDDLESDYEIIKKRLENVDQQFRWENAVFNKVVAILKRYNVSPQRAFEEFDKNHDGKLGREEFIHSLELLKITDLSNQEIDILMNSIDHDSDGFIKYTEFVRKLSRHGVKNRTTEEQIIYLIMESLKRSGVKSLAKAFAMFDKDQNGYLSREDFKDIFKNMNLKIDEKDTNKFIDHFWKDQKAGIDYQAFLRIFNRYQLKLDDDEKNARKAHAKIPDDVLRLKKRIYDKMNQALVQNKKTIKNVFDTVDVDQSNQIDLNELRAMFEKMKITMTPGEMQQIFYSIDFDLNGKVDYSEFFADFEHTVKTDITTLLQQEKERAEVAARGESQNMSQTNVNNDYMRSQTNQILSQGIPRQNNEAQLQTRVLTLEAKEKQLSKRLDGAMRICHHAQQSQIEVQNMYDQLEKKWHELIDQYHTDQQKIKDLQETLRVSIRKEEAMKLQEINEKLRTEVIESKAAMNTYKNMTEVISDQVKGLKLILERKKDENENLVNAVRELSSQSEDQKRMGKLYYFIMLSRWQEAAVNKKYEMVLGENREIRKELINVEQMLQNKEYDHHECENRLQDRELVIEQLKKQISDSRNIFLTLDKAESLNAIITEISDEKTELEEQYFVMRSKYRTNQLMMDEALSKAEYVSELLEVLQKSKQSDLSDRLIMLSEKLQGLKLSEMRSQRDCTETKEKNTYLSRLLRQQNDNVRKLEEENASLESKMHKREEEFRKKDNERMRMFFGARYDDIPGALAGNGDFSGFPSSRAKNNAFSDSDTFQNYRKSPRRQMDAADVYSRQGSDKLGGGSGLQQIGGNAQQNDAKYLEGKLKRLENEYNKALEDIRTKDLVINRLKEWQLADKYLSEDEVLRDAIENQRSKVNQVHEQEAKEMAEAAAQMVKTLQEMLNQKNEQLASKDKLISSLRQQMMDQREQDGITIANLQSQLSLAAGTTLSKLQEIVVKNEHGVMGGGSIGSRYERLTREELSKALDEKDHIIQQQQIENKAINEQLRYLKEKNHQLNDQISDLHHELDIERQQVELKTKVKELERVKKELHEKDKKNENLRAAIDKLNERMQVYEIKNSDVTEDQKMLKIQEDLKKKEHTNELKKIKDKMSMIESRRDKLSEEVKQAKVKEQELLNENNKLILERDELQKVVKQRGDRLDQEIRQREKLQIEINNIRGQVNIGRGLGSSNGPTYEQLLARNKELENDNIILQCQQKTVVVYNKESGTFEYIGEPIHLNFDKELTDIEEFLASLRSWLKRNERLTVKSIFESIDKENFGELTEAKFDQALHRMGVNLRQNEKRMIKDILDPRHIGFIKYRPLVRELSGVPQLDFIIKEIQKLAKLVESRDLDQHHFKLLIDPQHQESMNLTQLQQSIHHVNNEQFQMSNDEVEYLFKHVTKSVRTIGVTISIDRLTEKVFIALDALLIEKIKENIAKSLKPLGDLFVKYDVNKDNALEYNEFENLLLECQLAFKPNMLSRIYGLMDPGRKTSKISMNTIKFYLSDYSYSHATSSIHMAQRSYDFEPSLEKVSLSQETTSEEMNICRSGARKILQAFMASLPDQLSQRDKYNEGIISREEVQKCIEEQKVPELTPAELNILMKHADRGSKGYIAIANFIEKLQELATETKQDANLRGFAMNCKRQGINLKQELFKYDTTRTGRIDKKTFQKAMHQLPITLTDDAVEMLFQSGEQSDYRGVLDIKHFIEKVYEAQKYKPLQQNFQIFQQPKQTLNNKKGLQSQTSGGGAFENWEAEKKYKTKLAALQQQIEESKKETQATEKQVKHWQEMANKYEKEKVALQARLVDINAKPPKAATYESLNNAQLEQMQQLKDQVFHLQQENTKLERIIQVELKSEIGKNQKDNDKLVEKNKHLTEEVKRLEYQINRLIGKPMDNIEKREEGEFWREKKIIELEKEIILREKKEHEVNEQLFKAEERLLDLKFEKETFDLQYARLQKRITDLEQYKLESSKFSAVIKKQEDQQIGKIEDISNTIGGLTSTAQAKKEQDTVKLRSKSSKSVAELEMLIESLKRVIEKQKTENDQLKKQIDQHEKQKDKLKSEKQLRQKIESLELEVHNYEMKDVNVLEKDKTIKKLIEANRILREDLRRETERYSLLENKYKDILVKYNMVAKENAKNAEMLFTMNTGGNIHNYQNYLLEKDDVPKRDGADHKHNSRGFSASKKIDQSYDKNYEDIF